MKRSRATRFKTLTFAALLAGGLSFFAAPGVPSALAGDFSILPGGGIVHVKVPNLTDMKYQGEVRQRQDFGCGAAALATVLKYAYHLPVTEMSVVQGMLKVSDSTEVKKYGFSMLDMRRYVATLGLRSNGFKLPNTQIMMKLHVPLIVLLNIRGYEHFVVVRQTTPNVVFIADPALGMREMPTEVFLKAWQNRIAFLVFGKGYHNENTLVAIKAGLGPGELVRTNLPDMGNVTRAALMNFSASPWGLF